jgi:hypothetical protein|tara:strand:- start:5079 stop:5378 length:300 start_codon:yes stop_codon:yes gene_type:complete
LLIDQLNIKPEDVESRSMGAGGEDLIMSYSARQMFPYSVECKNQESLNVWSAFEQAKKNAGAYEPVLIIKKNRKSPLAVVDAEHFVELNNTQEKINEEG